MGSKISKAMRPREKAAVSVAPAPNHHDIDNANEMSHQDPAPQISPWILKEAITRHSSSHDDLYIATSTVSTMNLQRRNSETSRSTTREGMSTMEQAHLVSFEQFLAERRLMSIDWDLTSAPTQEFRQPRTPSPPGPERTVAEKAPQCLICCTDLPERDDLSYVKEVVRPCRSCNSEYCASCIKKMFVDACKDMARMPPRCCMQIQLHHARPHLSTDEANLFRAKYEEWSTPKPFYCPVPVCSSFISARLLPQHTKDKQRVDSVIGTPTPEIFECPTCDAGICLECRQPAHPCSICSMNEFGLDVETAELLKSWGYKQCPKCGHGLRRMFGCSHMECRCGAHFCWRCLENYDECGGGCYGDEDDEDEDDEDEFESDVESDISEDIHPVDEAMNAANATTEMSTVNVETPQADLATLPQNIPLPRNLDGGGARRWAGTILDFGDEPSNDFQDRTWDCRHEFTEYKITLSLALTSQTTEMECVRCWSTIHPQLRLPYSTDEKIVPATSNHARNHGVRGDRGLRRDRVGYVPPRGLFRANATIGTAPHLTATISPLSQSAPVREPCAMEDVQFSDRIVDTHGNIITTSPARLERRASCNDSTDIPKTATCGQNNSSSIFTTSPSAQKFNLAHECRYCNMLVCESCMDSATAAQEAREKKEEKREAARLAEEEQDRREREERQRAADEVAVTMDVPADVEAMNTDTRPLIASTQMVFESNAGEQGEYI